ncbi:hypothetical protein SAMN06296386_11163 [Lachnospiraceae bacterium]|nr:hypothetical protein SAMN06296386_11163 [Lachnospiraceae bacterium]
MNDMHKISMIAMIGAVCLLAGCASEEVEYKDRVWSMSGSIKTGTDSSEQSQTQSANEEVSGIADMVQSNLRWYDSFEKAVGDKGGIPKDGADSYDGYKDLKENIIFQSEKDGFVDVFFKIPMERCNNKPALGIMTLNNKDDKYSSPYDVTWAGFGVEDYSGDILDYTAEQFWANYVGYDTCSIRNGDHLWYCGWHDLDELKRLRIAGNPVTEIVPITFEDGKTYYFWYYNKTDLREGFKNIDFSGFTLREMEEALDLTLADQ